MLFRGQAFGARGRMDLKIQEDSRKIHPLTVGVGGRFPSRGAAILAGFVPDGTCESITSPESCVAASTINVSVTGVLQD